MFKQHLVKWPEKVKKGEKIEVKWDYDGITKDDVEFIEPGCGCLSALEPTDTGVKMHYDSSTDNVGFNSKNVKVYLKDGTPLYVKNYRGVKQFNPDKKAAVLFFHVNVTD